MAELRLLRRSDLDWLVELMRVPSVTPFEGGDPAEAARAADVFRRGAHERGMRLERLDCPPLDFLRSEHVPTAVLQAACEDPRFLADQPSLVMSMGDPAPHERRIVINAHLDTVGPHIDPVLGSRVLTGRGAVDDKGPAVAAVVGVCEAFRRDPSLARRVQVLVAAVPGEEGGAMGTYGTRWLVDQGVTGRLMVFAEPTSGRVLDACTATMTLRVDIHGEDSTDDHPDAGHNATLALAFLADHLMARVGSRAAATGAKLCLAGLHTGHAHNRVYGSGSLLVNIAFATPDQAADLAARVDDVLSSARSVFADRHGTNPLARRLVDDWDRVVSCTWVKRGIPALANRDPQAEAILARAGLHRHDGLADGTAFTCDAVWAPSADRYVVACGPGSLDGNGAHTPDEHVQLTDLDDYSARIARLVHCFADQVAPCPTALVRSPALI